MPFKFRKLLPFKQLDFEPSTPSLQYVIDSWRQTLASVVGLFKNERRLIRSSDWGMLHTGLPSIKAAGRLTGGENFDDIFTANNIEYTSMMHLVADPYNGSYARVSIYYRGSTPGNLNFYLQPGDSVVIGGGHKSTYILRHIDSGDYLNVIVY